VVRALTRCRFDRLLVVARPGREVVRVLECYEIGLKMKGAGKSQRKSEIYPSGCCRSDTRSSTAVADAIGANPGRVTVHI
jgi:hypothetical protein